MTSALLVGLLAFVPPADTCPAPAARLALDLEQSVVRWRGTKFFGLGSHEGVVRLKQGELCVRDGAVTGGWFVADMTTIDVTDIPVHDPVPRRRLREHLLSDDFFHVARHPEAMFRIGSVNRQHGRLFQVVGALTIRDSTHRVTFFARGWTVTDNLVQGAARFSIDRHQYGVSYVGSTIKDDLVDDEFSLDIEIVARVRSR